MKIAAAWLLALAPVLAAADPMRPLVPPAAAAAASSAAAPAAAPGAGAAAAPPRLVAIREDSQGRREALLGERWLAEGDRIDAKTTLARIHGTAVELALADRRRQTLHLLPPLVASVEPKSTLAAAAAPPLTRAAARRKP
jgi:hypothetical protein